MPAIRVSQRTKEEMEKMKEEMGFSTFNEIVREGNLHLQYAEERKAPKPASSD